MNKYYYKKSQRISFKNIGRIFGIFLAFLGIFIVLYISFPIIVWQLYFAPVFASEGINSPIPKTTILTPVTIKNLLTSSISSLSTNYDNPNNWFTNVPIQKDHYAVNSYRISIPAINITNAIISTSDTDLAHHMVQLGGSALPPDKGVTIIFGHSTLPQLFDPANYHTILANAYKIKVGDSLFTTVGNITYKYKVYSILVVNPDDTSALIQHYDDSFLELITCTPPGTLWQRLVIQSRLEKI